MTSFGFLDATSTDTPIFDEGVRDAICQVATSFEIGDRLRRATLFRSYLEDTWNRSNINTAYLDFVALIKNQEASFESVQRFLSGARKASNGGRKARSKNRG
jgi:hypothetical protein